MHSVYMTCSPMCIRTPPPHVCTQSVHNPASVGGDQVRDRATAAKSGVEAIWGRGPVGMGHTSELWTEPWGLMDRPCPAGASWRRTGEIQGLYLYPRASEAGRQAGTVSKELCHAGTGLQDLYLSQWPGRCQASLGIS